MHPATDSADPGATRRLRGALLGFPGLPEAAQARNTDPSAARTRRGKARDWSRTTAARSCPGTAL
eukprot:7531520-Pyramimonas_sp.AAC.1